MNNLKALREMVGFDQQKDFAQELGIPPNTYGGYENGQREPKLEFWLNLADKYKVSIDYLLGITDDPHKTKYGERSMLDKKYAALDEGSRKLVDMVMDYEAERFAVAQPKEEEKPKTKIIPLFPAAAGHGEPSDTSIFDDYEVKADSKAEFAVRISGDSMEPEFHHGDIVLCTKRYPEIGEIAAVMVNGFLVVKQFITDGQNIYLRSLNRKRKDLDLDLWASGSDTVKCYGTVIHKRIPLVMQ